jgi:hypothetical protein
MLASFMHVNNDVGNILPICSIDRQARLPMAHAAYREHGDRPSREKELSSDMSTDDIYQESARRYEQLSVLKHNIMRELLPLKLQLELSRPLVPIDCDSVLDKCRLHVSLHSDLVNDRSVEGRLRWIDNVRTLDVEQFTDVVRKLNDCLSKMRNEIAYGQEIAHRCLKTLPALTVDLTTATAASAAESHKNVATPKIYRRILICAEPEIAAVLYTWLSAYSTAK